VAVTAAQMHERPVCAGVNLGGQIAERGVESMIEADLDPAPGLLRALDQRVDLGGPERGRFLDEDMAPGLERALG